MCVLPSEQVGGDVEEEQGQPGVDDSPDREGPASGGDVRLVTGGKRYRYWSQTDLDGLDSTETGH